MLATREARDAADAAAKVASGPGRPLDRGIATDMGRRLGRDLSAVRIHTGVRASASAHALEADAYTVGDAIVFAEGRYAPEQPEGRALIAHELVHTLQQPPGPPSAPGSLAVEGPSSRAEREASQLAGRALWGTLPPSRQPVVSARRGGHAIMRAPATTAAPDTTAAPASENPATAAAKQTVSIVIRLTEEDFAGKEVVSAADLGVRGVMTLYGIGRDEAVRRIAAEGWTFFDRRADPKPHTRAEIGRPIQWVGVIKGLSPEEEAGMAQRRASLAGSERAAIYRAVDTEFARRIGSKRRLGRGAADAGARELWRQLLDERLRGREAAASQLGPGSQGPGATSADGGAQGGVTAAPDAEATPLDEALTSPRMRQYLGSGPSAGAPLSAEDTMAALEVAKGIEALSAADYQRFYAHPARTGTGSWSATLANLQRLQAARARDVQAGAALGGDAEMIALIEARKQMPIVQLMMLREAMEAAGITIDTAHPAKSLNEYEAKLLLARGFSNLKEYEDARTGPWYDAVQARALEVAHETLARAIRSARSLNHAMADDRLAKLVFEQLRPLREGGATAANSQLLAAYPFLANPKAWGYAMKATKPSELQWYLGYYVLSMLRGAEQIDERLNRHPDRVMQWDAVVQAALVEMSIAPDSPQAAFIAHGIGHAPDTSFPHALEEIADFAIYFVPGVGEAKAIGNFVEAAEDYDTGRVEASLELRSEDPSVVPVLLSLAAAAAPLGGTKLLKPLAKPFAKFGGLLGKLFRGGAEVAEAEAPQAARSVVPHVEAELRGVRSGMDPGALPSDYTRLLGELEVHAGSADVDAVRRALPVVMEALRTPRLYGEVLDEAIARAQALGGDFNVSFPKALRDMAAETHVVVDLPGKEFPPGIFFEQYAGRNISMVDPVFAGKPHGAMMHLIQDLVVTRALGRAAEEGLAVPLTSGQLRELFGALNQTIQFPERLAKVEVEKEMSLGEAAWRSTYDLFGKEALGPEASNFEWPSVTGQPAHMPTPEIVNPAIKRALAIFLGVDEKDVPLE